VTTYGNLGVLNRLVEVLGIIIDRRPKGKLTKQGDGSLFDNSLLPLAR